MSKLTEGDRYLLDQIRTGQSDGWSQLVDRYQGRLTAFARSQLSNAADAEDAVQETFLSFLKGLDRFREQASLETYLFSILRRKIIDSFRGRAVNVCSLGDTVGRNDTDSTAQPEALIAAPEPTASWYARRDEDHDAMRQTLWQVLHDLVTRMKQSLNFRHLQVAELVFYAQLRNKEIALLIGIDESQVALLKHRFLKQIVKHMSPQDAVQGSPADSTRDDVFAHEALLTQVWEQQRPSCPKRSTIGGYVLDTLDTPWRDFVDFHLHKLGCRFCKANLDDLNEQTGQTAPAVLRDRIMQSTVGFLRK